MLLDVVICEASDFLIMLIPFGCHLAERERFT